MPMPMYFFHLFDNETLRDTEGTNLIDLDAARVHAAGVARELTFKSSGMLREGWAEWTMRVHDADDQEVFSLALGDYDSNRSS
jgi:hypothetical protein